MGKEREYNLGPVEKIPLGQGFCFVIGEKEVAVFRPRSGGLYAVSNRCPHRKAPLSDGVIDQCQVICPYHGHKFNIQTGIGSEAGEQVQVYSVREENQEMIIEI